MASVLALAPFLLASAATSGLQDARAEALLESFRRAGSPAAVERLAREVDSFVSAEPGSPRTRAVLFGLCQSWFALGYHEKAMAALDRIEPCGDASYDIGRTYYALAEACRKAKDGPTEFEALKKALPLLEKPDPREIPWDPTYDEALQRLAQLHEQRRDWKAALGVWESWKPRGAWCGNEAEAIHHERALSIANAWLRLGNPEKAFQTLEPPALEPDCINGPDPDLVLQYLETALRLDRLAEAKGRIEGLPDSWSAECRRTRYRVCVAIIDAHSAKDPDGMLDAIESAATKQVFPTGENPPELEAAARLLLELGPPAVEALSKRIERGDPRATLLAGMSGEKAFVPVLEKRLAKETDPANRKRIARALADLRGEPR